MSYPRIFERVYCQPLCITPQRFQSIHALLMPRLFSHEKLDLSSFDQMRQPAKANKNPYTGARRQTAGPVTDNSGRITDPRFFSEAKPGVAVVPVYGAVGKNLSWIETLCGGLDINAVSEAVRQAVADDGIHTLVMDIDSPGGEVTGIPELANQIRAAGETMDTYAFTDAGQNSAAMWIASGAQTRVATASAQIGSIGTYLAWLDESVRMQLEGVQLQLFAEGKHKGIGLDGRPLSEDDKAMLQAKVKNINDQFKAAIQAACPNVSDDTMQGQSFAGNEAFAAGLVDVLVNDWDEFLSAI